MATNLVDTLKGYITPDLISRASNSLGESETGISKAISASIPTLLSGMFHKSDDSSVMANVMGLVKSVGSDAGNTLTNLPSLFSTSGNPAAVGFGSRLLGLLFGNRQTAVTDAIAGTAGIKASSASSVLEMVGAFILSYFAKSGTSLSSLTSLLSNEKGSFLSAVPSGLNFDYGNKIGTGYKANMPEEHKARSGGGRLLWPFLIALALLLGLYYFNTRNNKKVVETAVLTKTPKAEAPLMAESTTRATMYTFTLPNGTELYASESGIERKLTDWLKDPSKMVDKTTWFNFDRLLFDSGRATLRPESQEQLQNMAEILKAYPKVELKIGGYTDNVGNPAYNLRLSDQRAKTVKNELVKKGIAPQRLNAEGYGDKFPVASNATNEGKAQNRRIAVRVTKK